MNNADKQSRVNKYAYCPRCGNIERAEFHKYCSFCNKGRSFFDFEGRKRDTKETKLVVTDIEEPTPEEYVFIEEPSLLDGTTETLYRHIWETYVDVPGNENFNRELHEELKAYRLDFFHKGGIEAKLKADMLAANDPVRCPVCRSKSVVTQGKFETGKAIAGAVIAGAAGAVIGGKGGNKVVNVCQNCGHKWEPGSR